MFKSKEFKIDVNKHQTIKRYTKIPNFQNWTKNRPPDKTRIDELKEYYIREKIQFIPGIIYAWDDLSGNGTLQIYDGIHRLMAAAEIKPQIPFLMSVITSDNEDLVIRDFKALNKSCPVPSLYTDESDNEQINLLKRVVCENVVAHLTKQYPSFVSPSRKPFRYNFNRDSVLEWLSEFQIDWGISGLSNIITQELSALNFIAKDFVHRNNIQTPNKCKFHNFYLWYLDRSFIQDKIQTSIKFY
jgi:hypothetical protein